MRLAVSVGDPAGVGLLVTVPAVTALRTEISTVCFGDGARLRAAFSTCGWSPDDMLEWPRQEPGLGQVGIAHVANWTEAMVTRRGPTPEGGRAQLAGLVAATEATQFGRLDALVTGPVSKAAIVESGVPFSGHTEWLAERCGMAPDDVTMLFLGPRLQVGLVTTHVSVRNLPGEITRQRVQRSVMHLAQALERLDESGVLEVVGLNPHAGEGGLFGTEELDTIAPAVDDLRGSDRLAPRFALVGPVASEAAFRRAAAGTTCGVVAMMHDQATIASKLLDFGSAVNVTWGLPFVRTSVDHGVAYDAAERGTADHSGMLAALRMAAQLAVNPPAPAQNR